MSEAVNAPTTNFADGKPRSILPDGTVLEFEPDTPPEVIDRVFRQHLSEMQSSQSQSAAPPTIGTAKAAGIGGTQGLTFNLGDEIAAGIGATIGRPGGEPIAGSTWGDRYDNALTEARGVQDAAQSQHPVAYGAGEVAGAALPAVVAPELYGSSAIAAAPTAASAAGRAALAGGAVGAVSGFGGGEGGVKDRLQSAATGGAAGAAIGAVAAPIARAIGSRGPDLTIPSNDQLRAAGTAAYQAADNAGVIIAPHAMQGLEADVRNMLGQNGLDANLHPRIMAAYHRILQQANSGQPVTLRGLDILRQIAGDAADSQSRGERRLGSMIIEHIDDMVDRLGPHDLIQGDETVAVPALQQARQIWSSLRKSELVDELVHSAELQAGSTNSGGNLQNTIRQKLRTLLTNRSLGRSFNPEERAALEQLVMGTTTQNGLRVLGRLAPSSNSWLGVLSTLAAGPVGLAAPVVGAVAKSAADRSTQGAVQGLSEMVRSGAGLTVPTVAPSATGAAARALTGAGAAGANAASAGANDYLQEPAGGYSDGGVVTDHKPSLKEYLEQIAPDGVQHFAKGGVVLDISGTGERHDPVKVTQAAHAEKAGKRVADATPAQKGAGNYQHGHMLWNGLSISIETPKGGTRTAKDGSWKVKDFPATYGYLKRTTGADHEHVDVFFGDHPESKKIWIIDQIDPKTGKFDEHKCVLAAATPKQARDLYCSAFSDGSGAARIGAFSMVTVDQFKAWLKRGKRTKPFGKLAAPKQAA
jgi:hypothetical protein